MGKVLMFVLTLSLMFLTLSYTLASSVSLRKCVANSV